MAGRAPATRPTTARPATSTASTSPRRPRSAWTRSTATARAARRYLPDDDPDLSFAPTVLPEAVGGYFWVVFTSHRSYGNTFPSQDNGDENGKLWVAAIDLDLTAGQDSSHPAFYLDGQEGDSDNLRGFWVLPPCEQNGSTCSSGDECCTGFCRPDGEGGAYSCVPAPAGACSNEFEKCTTTASCCQASRGLPVHRRLLRRARPEVAFTPGMRRRAPGGAGAPRRSASRTSRGPFRSCARRPRAWPPGSAGRGRRRRPPR